VIQLPQRERESTRPPPQQVQAKEEEEDDDNNNDDDDDDDDDEDEGEMDEEDEEEDEGGGLAAQGKKRMQSEIKRKDKEPPLKLRALAPSPHVAQCTSAKEKRKEKDEMLDGQSRTPLFSCQKSENGHV
jgi:hypothetical protein